MPGSGDRTDGKAARRADGRVATFPSASAAGAPDPGAVVSDPAVGGQSRLALRLAAGYLTVRSAHGQKAVMKPSISQRARTGLRVVLLASAALAGLAPVAATAQQPSQSAALVVTGQVTEAPPSTMRSVISGADLRARGVRDLRGALALVGGADAPSGGDGGPASSVPAFWGLQEFDAFLLVIDGVPSGGAFSPLLTTLDFENIDRIEVSRGPAAATYGAASLVGVIEIFHNAPGATPATVSIQGGDRNRSGAAFQLDLPKAGKIAHSLSASGFRTDFSQDRSDLARAHALYRMAAETRLGDIGFDLDAARLRQTPYSPQPVGETTTVNPAFRFDGNANPADAAQDADRLQANLRLRRGLGHSWTLLATASHAHTTEAVTRGFLVAEFEDVEGPNAAGYRQKLTRDDSYLNAQLAWQPNAAFSGVIGATWAGGRVVQNSDIFAYTVPLATLRIAASSAAPTDRRTRTKDRRSFSTAYAAGEWAATDRLHLDASLRFDVHHEKRAVSERDLADGNLDTQSDTRTDRRWSGGIGATYALVRGATNLSAFARYADMFQAADSDLGPEAEPAILKPENARSVQLGLRGAALDGRLSWEASLFQSDNANLVIAENVAGLPSRANSGKDRFRGFEAEAQFRPTPLVALTASYARHDATFRNYARLRDDGAIQQLRGNRIEVSPQDLAGLGVLAGRDAGWRGSLAAHYVGARFLNKSNTLSADAYTTIDATVGYATRRWDVQLIGENLTDERPPVIESELGEDQFYTLPGRAAALKITRRF